MTYVQPVLPMLLVLLLAAVVAIPRWPRLARRVTLLVLVVLFLWSWRPFAWLTSASLEAPFPIEAYRSSDAEAIVVLAAGVLTPNVSRPVGMLNEGSYERTRYAAWLYRNWRPLPVLATGGALGPPGKKVVAAAAMKHLLITEGVPAESVWTEEKSLSTYENAVFSARLLHARNIRRIVLVTEGLHMRRAVLCFRKQGFVVTAAPCCVRSLNRFNRWTQFVPSAGAIEDNEYALHEWVGLLWYKLSGKI